MIERHFFFFHLIQGTSECTVINAEPKGLFLIFARKIFPRFKKKKKIFRDVPSRIVLVRLSISIAEIRYVFARFRCLNGFCRFSNENMWRNTTLQFSHCQTNSYITVNSPATLDVEINDFVIFPGNFSYE